MTESTRTGTPVLCIDRVKSGQKEAFARLPERHWPTLRQLGLVSEEPAQ